MKFQLCFPRILTLPMVSILLIIGAAALRPVCANDLQPLTDAERYVLQKLQGGQGADLEDRFPSELRVLRGSFVAALLTNRDYRSGASLYTIWIRKGVIIGELDLRGKDIPYDTFLDNCTFKD